MRVDEASRPAARADSAVVAGKARPRGTFPHFRRGGDFIFVSGTSARRADDSIAGAERDAAGGAVLDIRAQTRAVLQNIGDILASAGASLADVVEVSTYLGTWPTSTTLQRSLQRVFRLSGSGAYHRGSGAAAAPAAADRDQGDRLSPERCGA